MKFKILTTNTLETIVEGNLKKINPLMDVDNPERLAVYLTDIKIIHKDKFEELRDTHKLKGILQAPDKITYFSFKQMHVTDKYMWQVAPY